MRPYACSNGSWQLLVSFCIAAKSVPTFLNYDTVYTVPVDDMFRALSNCQLLHPDPEEVDYDEIDEDDGGEGI